MSRALKGYVEHWWCNQLAFPDNVMKRNEKTINNTQQTI